MAIRSQMILTTGQVNLSTQRVEYVKHLYLTATRREQKRIEKFITEMLGIMHFCGETPRVGQQAASPDKQTTGVLANSQSNNK